jgi:hypothetical protein
MRNKTIEKYNREDYGWVEGLNAGNAREWVLSQYPNAYNIDPCFNFVTWNYKVEVEWKLEGEELQRALISWGRVLHSTVVVGASSFTYFDEEGKKHSYNTTNYRTAKSETTYFVMFEGEIVPFELKDLKIPLGWNKSVGFNEWCNNNNVEKLKK